ncbi:MAG: hypothetical protein QXJ28_01550, partial [Candidatus Pacearchaeota archaeon]
MDKRFLLERRYSIILIFIFLLTISTPSIISGDTDLDDSNSSFWVININNSIYPSSSVQGLIDKDNSSLFVNLDELSANYFNSSNEIDNNSISNNNILIEDSLDNQIEENKSIEPVFREDYSSEDTFSNSLYSNNLSSSITSNSSYDYLHIDNIVFGVHRSIIYSDYDFINISSFNNSSVKSQYPNEARYVNYTLFRFEDRKVILKTVVREDQNIDINFKEQKEESENYWNNY